MRSALGDRAAQLDAAIEAARSANISVTRAKRLQKELQAQAAAAGASLALGEAVAEAAAAPPTADGQPRSLQVCINWHRLAGKLVVQGFGCRPETPSPQTQRCQIAIGLIKCSVTSQTFARTSCKRILQSHSRAAPAADRHTRGRGGCRRCCSQQQRHRGRQRTAGRGADDGQRRSRHGSRCSCDARRSGNLTRRPELACAAFRCCAGDRFWS